MNPNFQKSLKQAREKQILGNYDESIAEYKVVLVWIKEYITKEVKDPQMRQKWKQVNEAIQKELEMAKETNALKQQFKAMMGPNQNY